MPLHPTLSATRVLACALLLAGLVAGAAAAGKGEVNDLFVAGGNVKVDKPVTGDAVVAGGAVEIRAPISDRLRVAGGEVLIDSTIGNKVMAAGGKITIGPDAVIGGDATLYGGEAVVNGRVEGNLSVSAGKITINGQVRGNVVARGGSVELGPEARVGGTLHYSSGSLRQADGALVVGSVVQEARSKSKSRFTFKAPGRGLGITFFLVAIAVAALVLAVLPRFGARAAERAANSPASMIGLGFVTLIGVPVALVLLCITIIGIPVAFVLGAAVPVVLVLAFTLAVLGLGSRLPAMFRQPAPERLGGQLAWFTLALAAVMVVGTVPILGTLVMLLFLLAGLGAFALELPRRRAGGPTGGSPAAPRAVPA